MNLLALSVRGFGRNKVRSGLTVAGVAVATLTLLLLRTVIWSWTAAVDEGAADRIGVRHRMALVLKLPKRYMDDVRSIPGVVAAAYANWFDGLDPRDEHDFFTTIAVEPADALRVFDELVVPTSQVEAWKRDRRGAMIGQALAAKKGWHVGDHVTLKGTTYPGDWEFDIEAIYDTTRASVDRSTFYFHWDYLNAALPPAQQDQVSWIAARILDPGRSAGICREIDARFDAREVQTLCMSERAIQASFLGMLSALLRAIDLVSLVILLIMALILGNTIAMSVRERTQEYGVLRALGFMPRQIVLFILAEASLLGAAGGLLGVLVSYPVVDKGIGTLVAENLGAVFPFFRVQHGSALSSMVIAVVMSAAVALIPALRVASFSPVEALRRVG